MAFQILKPEISGVSKAVWNKVKNSKVFWMFFVFAFLGMTLMIIKGLKDKQDPNMLFLIFPSYFVIAISTYISIVGSGARDSFWKQLADINGWRYTNHGAPEQELGVMFRSGKYMKKSHIISGNINNRQFRIFNYEFGVKGSSEKGIVYHYTVFAFKFNGFFPHIYLNNSHNSYGVNVGEKIPLPAEFEKKFSLSAPKEYEIEALEIFTPDVLTSLLDGGFTYDIEFVNQEMLIFSEGQINNFEKLEKEFRRALELEDLFDEKLDKFKFQPIGDMPHSL